MMGGQYAFADMPAPLLEGVDASPLAAINQLLQSRLLPSVHLLVAREYSSPLEPRHNIAALIH
jgi:hypothetical protein